METINGYGIEKTDIKKKQSDQLFLLVRVAILRDCFSIYAWKVEISTTTRI